ncbi:hypothetical protein [Pelistega europaea]|uniref:Uncharacterized protein n=1 Tax=Pelistega europaea TaxID=106147 RepID=A0A7Y4L8E2_9BURK|nr:hypothetical protein [Pelistega europaea]NOL48828.1 hypothetical protein [Pelistega europaea]
MQQKLLCVLLGVLSSAAMADTYQLAHSKAEDLSIIVDNANEQNWCQSQVHFRFQGGPQSTEQGLAQLFPKLGRVFSQKCGQLTSFSWAYHDANHEMQLFGESSKANGWAYAPQRVGSSGQAAVAAQPAASAQPATSDAAAASVSAAQPATAPSQPTAPAVAAQPSTPAQPATPAVANQPADSAMHKHGYFLPAEFAVAGWTPAPLEERKKTLMSNLKTFTDQQGCKMTTVTGFGDQEQYIQFKTGGISCDADGFLDGVGSLSIERSDGAVLANIDRIWFNHGLPFINREPKIGPDGFTYKNDDYYYFAAGSSPVLKAQYFHVFSLRSLDGFGVFQGENFFALVDGFEDFKKADRIKLQTDVAMNTVNQVLDTKFDEFIIYFVDNLEKGFRTYGLDGKVYQGLFSRKVKWNGNAQQYEVLGPWKLNEKSYQTKNFAFERAKVVDEENRRKEQEKRIAAQRAAELILESKRKQAVKEAENLELYQEIAKKKLSSPDDFQKEYYALGANGYTFDDLLSGQQMWINSLIKLGKRDDDTLMVEWPYEMDVKFNSAATESAIEPGWYFVKRGSFSIDNTRQDKDGLPMAVLSFPDATYHCKEEQCEELLDPLTLTRVFIGDYFEKWTPESAQKLIDEVNKAN